MRDHFFESKAYWLFNFIGIMFILGGFSFLPLQQYTHHYVDILGKSFIALGIILILFPFIQIFFKSNFFKEHEVFYTFKDNGMTYQENEEAIFYSFPQFKRINYKDFILLKKDQKILFVDLNDLDQLENDIEETKIKKSSVLISLFTSVIVCSLLILQLGYFVVLKRFEFEYIHSMTQIIFNLIILC